MDAAMKTLMTKLTQLKITADNTTSILQTGSLGRIERHMKALKSLIMNADEARRLIEEKKITENGSEGLQEAQAWSEQIEEDIAKSDLEVTRLRDWLGEAKDSVTEKNCKEELNFQKELFETKLNYQKELEKLKATKIGRNASADATASCAAKLPKIIIAPFNGTYRDWTRWWGQFRETIDKSNVAAVTKFSFLKEFVDTKVRMRIDGLQFTTEGYNRVKSILFNKYGKESEIIKAHTKEILDLPCITGAKTRKIHKFYEKLQYSVQLLETMGKLEQVNGNLAMTLDKLPSIHGDLVRTDLDWEKWNFVKLVEALNLWTRRNLIENTPYDSKSYRNPCA